MPVGFIERVKQPFASKKKAEPAPSRQPQKKSEVLGSMSFEQAQAFLTPNGPLDRSLRPPASSYQTLPLKKPAAMYTSPAQVRPQTMYTSPAQVRPPTMYTSPAQVRPQTMYESPIAPGAVASPYSEMPPLVQEERAE